MFVEKHVQLVTKESGTLATFERRDELISQKIRTQQKMQQSIVKVSSRVEQEIFNCALE